LVKFWQYGLFHGQKWFTMTHNRQGKRWSPYLAGALAGIVFVLSVWIAGKVVGASTSFVRTAGMIEKQFTPGRVARMDYFVKEDPKIDWQWMFVLGILIGSLVSSTTDHTFEWKALPDMWEARFGPSRVKRGLIAFTGGMVAMFGARLAGG
jgi:hypothetical protein